MREDLIQGNPVVDASANGHPSTEAPHVPAAFVNAIAEEGTKAEAVGWLQKQWNENCQQRSRIARLESDLNECREYLEDIMDVNDGDYGEPSPNRAMQLVNMIDETINGRPY